MSETELFKKENANTLEPIWQTNPHAVSYKGERGPGCPVNCAYCNQKFFNYGPESGRSVDVVNTNVAYGIAVNTYMKVGNHLIAEVTAQDAISTLLKNPVYSKNQALVFENFTEPGLNWKKTLKMMRLAIEEGHYGALLAITKLPLSDDDIGDLQKLQHEGGFPIIGVSYANLPQELEPGSNGKLRVRTMKRLYEAGIPVIHSLRPLIAGINIGEEEIEAVVKETLPYSTVIVPGGLVVDPVILPTFELRGYPLTSIYSKTKYSGVDVFPDEEVLFGIANKVKDEQRLSTPIHKYMSCAISLVMTDFYRKPTVDRVAHWAGIGENANRWNECNKWCPGDQIDVCKNASRVDSSIVVNRAQEKLADLGFNDLVIRPVSTRDGLLVVEKGMLPRHILYVLTESCGWYVNNLPDREQLLDKSTQVAKDKLGIDLESIFVDCKLVDDIWEIVVKNIDEEKLNNLTKWLRGSLMTQIVLSLTKE